MYGNKEIVKPRNGHTLVVGVVARISGCTNQKELSLEDQVDHANQDVADFYNGPVELRIVATKGKGEWLDRPELEQIEASLRSRELDFMWFEDLGRLVRGEEAVRLMGIGVDHGTVSICPHDGLDTRDPTWHQDALNACAEHVAHQEHTSRRIKIKTMNRFKKFGGSPGRPIAGYIVPPGAKTYGDWQKDEPMTLWIEQGLRILADTKSGEAVAKHLNQVGMPTGPYCMKDEWDGKMALRFYRNRLLGGAAGRGIKHCVKHNESGRRVSIKNPGGPSYKEFPHLAHVDLVLLDETIALLAEANENLGSPGTRKHGVGARRCSIYPGGGGATCWYCGRPYVWGGNGITVNLMCSGSRERCCWNSFGINGTLVSQRVMETLTQELYALDCFDEQYGRYVEDARRDVGGDRSQKLAKLLRDAENLAQQKRNVGDAIAQYGLIDMLQQKLADFTAEERRIARERAELARLGNQKFDAPGTVTDLRRQIQESFVKLAQDSTEFAIVLKKLVPSLHIYLVRLADGGHPYPRAMMTLELDGLVPNARHIPGLPDILHRKVTIDLFQEPPQREKIRADAVALALKHLDQRAIARTLGVTQPAVGAALHLQKLMEERRLSSSFIPLVEPPNDYAKLRRHHHPQYSFRPLDGYVGPTF